MRNSSKSLYLAMILASTMSISYGKVIFTDLTSTIDVKETGTIEILNSDFVGNVDGIIQVVRPENISPTSEKIFFRRGIYTDSEFSIILTATYDATASYSIQLNGGDASFDVISPGVISERVLVSNTGSRMEGQPSFRTPNTIMLTSDITFDLISELNSSVDLGGGTILLGGDLSLSDGVKFNGEGEVQHRSFNLILGQEDLLWTDTIRFRNATNLDLGSDNIIRGMWSFFGDAHIVGNNFGINLTNGGVLLVGSNTTVRMSNLILTGLGSGSIIFTDSSSQLELYNVIFDMDDFVSFTNGGICVTGETIIVTRNNLLTFDMAASLTVDRASIVYDNLTFNDNNNIRFASLANNLTFTNGGIIRNINGIRVGDHLTSENKKLDREFIVSPLRRLFFDSNSTINGDGFFYQFARDPGMPIIIIEDGFKGIFENILMKDFPVENVTIGDGSQLFFGHNTSIELGENGVLTDSWQFEGKVILNGSGKTLIFGNNGRLVLRPGSSLLLDNIVIKGINANSLICLDDRCTVSFGNVLWKQDEDYSFTQGCFEVTGLWEIQGTSTFEYRSTCTSTITQFGTMNIDKNSTFHYEPPIPNRDLIAMVDEFSLIHLSGGDLSSSTTGLRLTKGTLFVSELCELRNNGAVAESEGFSFGNGTPADDLNVRIDAAATLELKSGILVYDNEE